MKLLSLLLTLFALNSCGNSKAITTSKQEAKQTTQKNTEKLSGTFYVQVLENKNIIEPKLTLTFNAEDNRVSGFAGCNNFSGAYTTSGNTLKIDKLIRTEKYCKRFMDIEQSYIHALQNTSSYILLEGTLFLKNEKQNLIEAQQKEDKSAEKQQTTNTIQYTAATRGFYTQVIINNGTISIQKDSSGKANPETRKCSEDEITHLKTLLQNIDLKLLSTYEGPTKKRMYDGAANATLKIIGEKGESFETPNFDHGYPNSNIAAFVNAITKMAKME
ncbi:MAG: META domain-containing protein [Oceanihabitans sp.]